MKRVRLEDLRALLESPEFSAWWTEWQRVSSAVRDARAHQEALVAQSRLMAARSETAQRAAHSSAPAGALAADEAERLFREAEERRARSRQLAEHAASAERELRDAQAARDALREAAREKFRCVPGESFLYWRKGAGERAFAVSLSDEPGASEGAVKALGIYVVGRRRGVVFLEPARDARRGPDGAGGASGTDPSSR